MSITPRRVLVGAALCALIFSWSTFVDSALAAGPVGGCTFDVECDDGNPCTEDRCLFDPGSVPGSGTCDHDPLPPGAAGECDDGVFCNGAEVCDDGGQCVSGPAATCCDDPDLTVAVEYCTEDLGRCSFDSLRPVERCATDAQCGGGKCFHCQPACQDNADCDDARGCNGTETCVSGQCVAGIPPCGNGAICSETRCVGQTPAKSCATDEDCIAGFLCNNSAGPLCYRGRCCTGTPPTTCSIRFLGQGGPNCLSLGGNWFAGDSGDNSDVLPCGGVRPAEPGVALGCPPYGSGIAQTSLQPPAHPVAAGPVSKSPQAVDGPNGPGTPLYRLGDDYVVSDGSHLQLKAFRFVATVSGHGSVKFDFLDETGEPVGSVTTDVLGGTGVRVAFVDAAEALVIPPSGYIAASITNASPNAEFTWHSAGAATTGSNDPNKLFVNDTAAAANFMAPAPGILSFELLGPAVAAPLGACCTGAGACSELTRWVCSGQGGHFQGVGSVCPNAACDAGACCDAMTGVCELLAEIDCTDNFQGVGTACQPNCCPQPVFDSDCSDGNCYTGADNMDEVFVHVIPSLPCIDCGPGGTPLEEFTITVSGDNSFAGSGNPPDSCFGPAEGLTSDSGWFEGFSLIDCTMIRIDYCCSQPQRPSIHPWLAGDFACQNLIPARPELDVDALPHCDDGNAWAEFGPLGPADYFIPIPSALVDPHGPYQMHITATACEEAACCLPDGSCAGPMDQLACEAQGGAWLGRPLMQNPVADCTNSPCATGSCCTSDNQCQDEIGGVPIDKPTCDGLSGTFTGGLRCQVGTCAVDADFSCNDDDDCVAAGGGTCPLPPGTVIPAEPTPCPLCEFESPANCQQWDDPHSYRFSLAEVGHGSGLIVADDFIPGPGLSQIDGLCVWGVYEVTDQNSPSNDCGETRAADHFRVRVLGSNWFGFPDVENVLGASEATAERRLLPGAGSEVVFDPPVATYQIHLTLDNAITGLTSGETYWLEVANHLADSDQCNWRWVQLSNESPQGNRFSARGSDANGYLPGGELAFDQSFCLPGPMQTPPPLSRPCCSCEGGCGRNSIQGCQLQQDELAVTGVNEGGDEQSCFGEYVCPTDGRPKNDECANAQRVGVGLHPLSVHCATTDPNVNPVLTDFGLDPTNFDVWFELIAPQDCLLRADMCATGNAFDSVIAIYSNGTADCNCPIGPGNIEPTFLMANDEGCTAATGTPGAGFVEVPAQQGQCFLIRIGNWGPGGTRGKGAVDFICGDPICGDNAAQVSIGEECDGIDDSACPGLCHPPGHEYECRCGGVCGDGVRSGTEECDATDDDACGVPGSCNFPGHVLECHCGPPNSCGNNVREGLEDCDGTDSVNCPGLCVSSSQIGECTCQNICGSGVREGVEECDGPADTTCGGVAGRCIAPGQPGECTCPPVVCGNDFADPGEVCDGTDDELCPGQCREPGDPAGECTCRCGVIPFDPDPLLPESPAMGKVRFISFVVPATGTGEATALRVELISLHHPSNPPPGTPDFSAHEGSFRYVNSFGGSTTCVDSATFNTNYRCGRLGCQPEYRDWFATLSNTTNPTSPAGLIHVTGEAVVPSSTYGLSMIASLCGPSPQADTCTTASFSLAVSTTRWGDVGGSGASPPDGVANVIDIGLVIDNVRGLSTAVPERRAWMKNPARPDLNPVNVIDIGHTVNTVRNLPFPYIINVCLD